MPSQKQATLSSSSPSAGSENSSPVASAAADPPDENPNSAAGDEANSPSHSTPPQEQDDSDGEGGSSSTSSQSSDEQDEYVLVKLMDIRKEVQCPICLGIIRKTRTVMECLHRFCRECIDKSMRLGNNECPACRTHCASRRSLRDDPNFDALIAALYPDIDKYEEEELAFHEEEKTRYKKIQASIAETFRRQAEALGKRRPMPKSSTEAFRRSDCSYRAGQRQNGYFRGRGKTAARNASPMVSDDDEEEEYANGNDAGKDSSSAEEASPDRRPKRCRLMAAPRSSPARLVGNADLGYGENCDFDMNRETFRTSPLRAGNRELSWGKGGARSQTRHGNSSGLNGRFVKAARLAKLMEYLRNLDENENEYDIHLKLLPLNEQSLKLDSPYICCPPTISIKHICEFIAIQTSVQVEGVTVFVKKHQTVQDEKVQPDSEELQVLDNEASLVGLLSSLVSARADLELVYKADGKRET
ncbi:putative E3 ubiquitin-protein ligase RING1a isoform X2 [Phalaenopsis equestris]|uniref:putative E3 ubiquitin-protein ligase RING1a isoform X2 n=1 Tax=Phalaenopsis equestris TaxID=78828 RepID=UPI0009E5502B|nr:putative E3 ubiquitin-protein ligase RING1a isoform X2 [Phalaenopsis equestris]